MTPETAPDVRPDGERIPINSISVDGVDVERSGSEWPTVSKDSGTGEVLISGPDHHGLI
ncbi:MAG TPA: hypothetical protein VJH67_01440 [Candidatus Paceibacterota bacterium]